MHLLFYLLRLVVAEDVVHRVFFLLLYLAVLVFEWHVFHHFRHNLLSEGTRVCLGVHRVYHLHLHLQHLVAQLLVVHHAVEDSLIFGEDELHVCSHAEDEAHEGTLLHPYVF